MSVGEAFDEWAAAGRDRGMEERHWHTAKQALAAMPIEPGDRVIDLGTGSGYAARAMVARGAELACGIDQSAAMAANARSYTEAPEVCYALGDFRSLPFATDAIDHAFSMEALYYAPDPETVLRELHRVLRPGGTFHCAVDYYAENPYSADWDERTGLDLTRWSRREYRVAFRETGFAVAEQRQLPDREVTIPPEPCFPLDADEGTAYRSRSEMVERFRELGTLLTVGVAR